MPSAPLDRDAQDRAETACRRLAQAFVAHLDHGRYEAVGALFTADGVMQRVSGDILRGPAEIADRLRRPAAQSVIHHTSPVHVELIDADAAIGTSSFLAFMATPDDASTAVRVAAIWTDHYRREAGEWRIDKRMVDVRLRGALP
jgi:ketosteroid isomerase-like protein